MKQFASLCLLGYKRPIQLSNCIDSLIETADFPYELIVNLDTDSSMCSETLFNYYRNKKISKLVLVNGDNRGVGRSMENCIGLAEGDYIFKIDTDLTFNQKWLSTSINILKKNPQIGALSLFDYRKYDPFDKRFWVENEMEDYLEVNDFVSSIYGFRREMLEYGVPKEDDGWHKLIQSKGNELAITKKDYVVNHGFGVGKSVYVSGTPENPFKTPTYNKPLVFLSGLE